MTSTTSPAPVDTAPPEPARAERAGGWVTRRPVLVVGVALVLAQLAFRGWMLTHAWFAYDDFLWIQEALESDLTLGYLLHAHVGHLMPAGFLLTWLNTQAGALTFFWPALELWLMSAVAGFGMLRLLRHLFGERPGILPPLAVFLFTPITLPAATWWAAGVNQLPVIIAMVFGLHALVSYLRTRVVRHAWVTAGWVVVGLLFSEKTLVVYVVFAAVALGYFSSGHLFERVSGLWRRYTPGILLLSGLVAVYLPYYLLTSINFEPGTVREQPLGDLTFNMVAKAFASAIVGGPLEYVSVVPFSGLAAPSELFLLVAWAAVGAVVLVAAQTRVRSKRAWSPVAALLGANVLLVAAGRATVVGPVIGLEYRYQTEVAAAAALSLALAFLPLRGAVESAELRRRHWFVDAPRHTTWATALVVGLACWSSVQFMALDRRPAGPEAYFDNFARSLAAVPEEEKPVPMADLGVPERIWGPTAFPSNLYSHMFVMYDDQLAFRDDDEITSDAVNVVDDRGRIRPMVIDPARRNEPGRLPGCGYRVDADGVEIPLDGPVFGFGWWIRIAYVADGHSPVTAQVGDETYHGRVRPGMRNLYLQADGEYDSITLSGVTAGVRVCTNDVELGRPRAFEPVERDGQDGPDGPEGPGGHGGADR